MLLILFPFVCFSQQQFSGSFLITFKSDSTNKKPSPPMALSASGEKILFEIKDAMNKKGVTRKILFDAADSTWLMAIQYNKVKEATRMHGGEMFRDSVNEKLVEKNCAERKKIGGLLCEKMTVESKTSFSEIWIAKEIDFNLPRIYRMLCHCGMMGSYMRSGDWYFMKPKPGIIMEVTSRNKKNGDEYTLTVSNISKEKKDTADFRTIGFRISDIPEGQNCAASVPEK